MRTLSPLPKTAVAARDAFTLLELLVAVSIIIVLMGLLFPAATSAMNSAKKATAKNQVIQIATAITAYETEYGRLPSVTGSNVDATLVSTLCSATDTNNNPRGIIFLDATAWRKGKGGTNTLGYCDPFASNSAYSLALDSGYTNSINVPVVSGTNVTTTNITKHVGVWTIWTNGKTQTLINSWD